MDLRRESFEFYCAVKLTPRGKSCCKALAGTKQHIDCHHIGVDTVNLREQCPDRPKGKWSVRSFAQDESNLIRLEKIQQ